MNWSDPPQDLVGTEIAGRFRITELLGEGGAGQVYLAEHNVLDRRFAIKVLQEYARQDQGSVERFHLEARAASLLDHPNIVRITDFGRTTGGRLYLVMEYVAGQSLEQLMEELRPAPLALDRAIPILAQVCSAVQAAHAEGIVHRDLKPDNVVLGKTLSGDEQVKVLDFGLAAIVEGAKAGDNMRITGRGQIFGTPEFMAPEQARGDHMDQRSDVYSLGAMAYDLLGGRAPIEHNSLEAQLRAIQEELPEPLSRIRPSDGPLLPVELEVLVHRCLMKNPDDRPSSVDGLVRVFEAHRAVMPARRPTSMPGIEVEAILRDTDPEVLSQSALDEDETEEIDPFHDAPSTLVAGTAPSIGTVENKPWFWSQAIKKAQVLVARLSAVSMAPDSLQQGLAEVLVATERVFTVETELAVERALLDEPDVEEREGETRIRSAIIDLSIDRDRIIHQGTPDEPALEDLDYQIRVLETNLGELYADTAQRQANQSDTVREMEGYAEICEKQLRDNEAQLIKEVFQARPTPCPPDLATLYGELASALLAYDSADT